MSGESNGLALGRVASAYVMQCYTKHIAAMCAAAHSHPVAPCRLCALSNAASRKDCTPRSQVCFAPASPIERARIVCVAIRSYAARCASAGVLFCVAGNTHTQQSNARNARAPAVQVMQLSMNIFQGVTDANETFWRRTSAGAIVYCALRGSGLLGSAVGALTAPTACDNLIAAYLRSGPVGTRADHLLVGVRCGRMCDIAPPGMMTLPSESATADAHGLAVRARTSTQPRILLVRVCFLSESMARKRLLASILLRIPHKYASCTMCHALCAAHLAFGQRV